MTTETLRVGERMRATYAFQPLDRMVRAEFYLWPSALERWKAEGLPEDWEAQNYFNYDPLAIFGTGVNLGWTEPALLPLFEERIVEQQGEYEIIQDGAGRWKKVFKGIRHGVMPEYLKHAVSNMADWEALAPRLDPQNSARWDGLVEMVQEQRRQADAIGGMVSQHVIGGYMYLRAIMGPVDLLYMFYDQPEVVHAAMQGWFNLADAALARVQAEIEIDEIFFGEDICYNHGLLVSPDTVRDFLFPYYQQLLGNARARQPRPVAFHLDTDGDCLPAIPLYSELGLTRISPNEVASGCDVVAIGRRYPNLVLSGGIDKRVLAAGKEAIDAHLNHIMPAMRERGGYFPTCDHGVPDDVSLENYLYYRRRVCELDHIYGIENAE